MTSNNPALIRLALDIKKQLDSLVAGYEEQRSAYARAGFRPRRCYHGVDLWVDYDPMCRWCEDDSLPRYWETAKWALIHAHNEMNRVAKEESHA